MAWQVYDAAGPHKRWVKQPGDLPWKLKYRRRPYEAPDNIESRARYNSAQAYKYVEWLAARDGIRLPSSAHHPIHEGPRVRGISWGCKRPVYATRKNGRKGAWLRDEWVETFRVEIPNWDFVHPPIEKYEEIPQ